jgi:hypothetical protein
MSCMPGHDLAVAFQRACCESELVANLVCRWADERQYEDLAEYMPHLQSVAPAGVTVTRGISRPFGCRFTAGGANFTLTITTRGRCKLTRV